ncbi:UDP-N-acetylmuramate--L-alanine ligase [Candidatus Kaiserbacteria bacterium]|nr:MAG: UDP-N-acetylmuramate--L-alanine ligase [Candidatus Kaiserbacteria bacterium]
MKLSDIQKVHFVGIGGIGMSALARLFLHEKKQVSGSDRTVSDIIRALSEEGVQIFDEQRESNVTPDIDLLIYTEAMSHDHEELKRARALGIITINYFDALGMVANEYYLIAVAGSHGKTTTTAMLIDIFEAAGFDPSGVVGSLRAKTKSNYRAGKSKYFIVEACEYKRDFLSLTPDILVITNLEHEHVDYYKNLGEVQQAFREFACQVREGGVVIVNFSGENIAPILESVTVSVQDYGKYFDPLLSLMVPGIHNQMNAAAAIAAAEYVGISRDVAKAALTKFVGTWRRFEYKGEVQGAKVYDDYGHHPTEIAATLQGARELYPDKKITLVFQSHTYSRTNELFDDFVSALSNADEVYILPIYAAREENESGVSHTLLSEAVAKGGVSIHAHDSFETVVKELKAHIGTHDVVLVMGAGDITHLATQLVS